MTVSQKGLDLIKSFENCRLEAYLDEDGIPTIGWGHTPCQIGDRWTQDIADSHLLDDAAQAETIINFWVKAPLTQNQFDALTSFVFNIGPGRVGSKDGFIWLKDRDPLGSMQHSTLLSLLNDRVYVGAADQIPLWCRAGGKISNGLFRRRMVEKELFETPDTVIITPTT